MRKRTPAQRQTDTKARLGFVLSLIVFGASVYTGWPGPGGHWRLVQALTLAAGALGLVINGAKLARGRRAMHTGGTEETADEITSAPPPDGGIGSR